MTARHVPSGPLPSPLRVAVAGGTLRGGRWHDDDPESGRAGTVVAVHDLTANHLVWQPLAEALAGEVRVVAPDLRGRLGSAGLPGPFGLDAHAADVVACLPPPGRRIVLVGHGYGAWVAAAARQLALASGREVAGLLLADPLPAPGDDDPLAAFATGLGRLDATFASRDAYLAHWRRHPAFSRGLDRAARHALLAELRGAGFAWRPVIDRTAVCDDAAELRAPSTVSRLAGLLSSSQASVVRPADVERGDHESLVLGRAGAAALASRIGTALRGRADGQAQ